MPRGGPRGNKKNYKGQRRHFSDVDELKVQEEKKEREKEWRRKQGLKSDDEDDEEEVKPGDLPPNKDSSSEEDSSDEEVAKPKGVSHLIEIENPNRVGGRALKKVTELGDGATQLSRREREELEKQQAKVRYQQLHVQGKTEEARADLARLALIRKQREEAAKKRDEEKAAEEKKKTKS